MPFLKLSPRYRHYLPELTVAEVLALAGALAELQELAATWQRRSNLERARGWGFDCQDLPLRREW